MKTYILPENKNIKYKKLKIKMMIMKIKKWLSSKKELKNNNKEQYNFCILCKWQEWKYSIVNVGKGKWIRKWIGKYSLN